MNAPGNRQGYGLRLVIGSNLRALGVWMVEDYD